MSSLNPRGKQTSQIATNLTQVVNLREKVTYHEKWKHRLEGADTQNSVAKNIRHNRMVKRNLAFCTNKV